MRGISSNPAWMAAVVAAGAASAAATAAAAAAAETAAVGSGSNGVGVEAGRPPQRPFLPDHVRSSLKGDFRLKMKHAGGGGGGGRGGGAGRF